MISRSCAVKRAQNTSLNVCGLSNSASQSACSVKVWCTKVARIFENSGPNWSKLSSFVDKHHILHVIDLISV